MSNVNDKMIIKADNTEMQLIRGVLRIYKSQLLKTKMKNVFEHSQDVKEIIALRKRLLNIHREW